MAKQYAKATIQGRVFKVDAIGSGAKIRLKVNPGTKNKDGTWVDDIWFTVVVWHKGLVPYVLGLNRDDDIFIEGGRIEENKFTPADGQERKSWQIALPAFNRDIDFDIDRQLGTFGAAESPKAKHPAEVPFDAGSDIPF